MIANCTVEPFTLQVPENGPIGGGAATVSVPFSANTVGNV
jgi:hypothetical protein